MTTLDWALIMNAAFLTGMSVMIFSRYTMSRHMLHIVSVAGSYTAVVCLLSSAMIWHVFVGEHSQLFIVLSIAAFLLGDLGVILMFMDKKRGTSGGT